MLRSAFPATEWRQQLAWGVSPRKTRPNQSKPWRGDSELCYQDCCRPFGALGAHSVKNLGLTPQATRCRRYAAENRNLKKRERADSQSPSLTGLLI